MVYPGKKSWAQFKCNHWMLATWNSCMFSVAGAYLLIYTLYSIEHVPARVFILTFMWFLCGLCLYAGLYAGLIGWLVFRLNYEITETSLIVRNGPFRWTVPLGMINDVCRLKAVKPLHADAILVLSYPEKNGYWAKCIPCLLYLQDPAAFLRELTERQPGLEVLPNGSLHGHVNADVKG